MQATHANSDAIALLWTQSPRFVDLVKGVTEFQHPHYFFNQTDKLNSLLHRVAEDTNAYGPSDDYQHAGQVLTQLLDESLFFGTLTRENLRVLEPSVREFVDKIQAVDGLAAEWDVRQKQRQLQLQAQLQVQAQTSAKATSKKRGRSDSVDDDLSATWKRRRDTCGEEVMEAETGFNNSFASRPPWMHSGTQCVFGINPNFYD